MLWVDSFMDISLLMAELKCDEYLSEDVNDDIEVAYLFLIVELM